LPWSPRRSPRKLPTISGARPSAISKARTPRTVPRYRGVSVLSLDGSEAELTAIEQEGTFATAAGDFTEVSNGREVARGLAFVALTSPPRAVLTNASEARSARLKSRTTCMKLSNKDAFMHVERLGCHGIVPLEAHGMAPGGGGSFLPAGLGLSEEKRRPLSRQSSLSSIVELRGGCWGPLGVSGRPLTVETPPPPAPSNPFEASIETPPANPGALSLAASLCRAPQQSRTTLASRSSNRIRAASSTANTSTAASNTSAATAAAPFPRRPVWGELAHVPSWDDHAGGAQAQLQGVAQEMRGFFPIGSECLRGGAPSVTGSRASRALSDDSATSELCAALGPSVSQQASGSQDTTYSGSQDASASQDVTLPLMRDVTLPFMRGGPIDMVCCARDGR